MTQDKTPTEALAQLRHLYAQLKSQDGMSRADRARIADGILSPAIAALEKWGSPVVAGESLQCTCDAKDMPVGTCCKVRSAFETWYDEQNDGRVQPFDVFKGGWVALHRKISTPQPTQPQAGAVPLTCEWAHNENDGFWESACGEAWRFDDDGPAENSMHFCHSCGKSLRIKGKEAGNAE